MHQVPELISIKLLCLERIASQETVEMDVSAYTGSTKQTMSTLTKCSHQTPPVPNSKSFRAVQYPDMNVHVWNNHTAVNPWAGPALIPL